LGGSVFDALSIDLSQTSNGLVNEGDRIATELKGSVVSCHFVALRQDVDLTAFEGLGSSLS
jgi:hypothetical protein